MNCLSTHGASGYAPGSYFENGVVVCGNCGEHIVNPRPIGYRHTYFTVSEALKSWPAFRAWLKNIPKSTVSLFP